MLINIVACYPSLSHSHVFISLIHSFSLSSKFSVSSLLCFLSNLLFFSRCVPLFDLFLSSPFLSTSPQLSSLSLLSVFHLNVISVLSILFSFSLSLFSLLTLSYKCINRSLVKVNKMLSKCTQSDLFCIILQYFIVISSLLRITICPLTSFCV